MTQVGGARKKLTGIVETSETHLRVEFADKVKCTVNQKDLEQFGSNLNLKEATLPSTFAVVVPEVGKGNVRIPWDFFRTQCDQEFVEEEEEESRQIGQRLGGYIKRTREDNGFTQGELAEAAGLARHTVNRVENGRNSPTYETLSRIASALNYSTTREFLRNFRSKEEPSTYMGREKLDNEFDSSNIANQFKSPQEKSNTDVSAMIEFGYRLGVYDLLVELDKNQPSIRNVYGSETVTNYRPRKDQK